MSSLSFYRAAAPGSAVALASAIGAEFRPARIGSQCDTIASVAPLTRATAEDLSVFVPGMESDDLASTRAGACCVASDALALVPLSTAALVVADPLVSFALLLDVLQISNLRLRPPRPAAATIATKPYRLIEDGVTIAAGAVIGSGVEIGSGTVIGPCCVIGDGVRIGRDCEVESHVALSHCFIGDRVAIGAGARIGGADLRTGLGAGPSIGRVIVQSEAVVGANAVVARGRFDDTIIGERSTVGALVIVEAGILVPRNGTRARRG